MNRNLHARCLLIRLSLWTAVGAAITTAVAWIMAGAQIQFTSGLGIQWIDREWPIALGPDAPAQPDAGLELVFFGGEAQSFTSEEYTVHIIRSGLPFRCYEQVGILHHQGTSFHLVERGRLPSWLSAFVPSTSKEIPAGPIWRGFALNTFAYGLLGFCLRSAPGVARRRLRTRRRRCANCGYDLRGIPGQLCPECGR